MRTPAFWAGEPGLPARLLQPLGLVYGGLTALRMRRAGTAVPVPVVCIGNPTAGGAGKTPVALAFLHRLRARGDSAFAVSRGYGGRLAGPVEVDPLRHASADVGDEPLLLARAGRTVVARDRLEGARLAVSLGATLIVLDDGLQNQRLARDASLAVVDAGFGVGNGLCVPAGPLRAPLPAQWPLVDRLLLIGEGAAGDAVAAGAERSGIAVFRARLAPDPTAVAGLIGRPLLAFAGIGRPEKFFATLGACGLDVRVRRAYPDHHPYRAAEISALLAAAREGGLTPVTTEKDHVRLPADHRSAVMTLPVTLTGADGLIDDLVALAQARGLTRLSVSRGV
jgi:tetraacyldisaccharide 4'-kinase